LLLLLLLHRWELLEIILLLLLLLWGEAARGTASALFLHALFPFQVRQKFGWDVP
jgi:hypothetical protein